ncbi:hypothetical protein [Mycolicibacterium sp. D5.8-2]|uniref:hypothetical protein n=1 Tax=Mycolicibacterium sp. D5.8-2 TaxID=3085903 RepID=UPI00298D4030|nr:hypothetical protein [Mycolicibacterium sp. D5.8-2]MDW5612625.1 hypothetical protein [Mycolicibacterium sp. D5.8-2]
MDAPAQPSRSVLVSLARDESPLAHSATPTPIEFANAVGAAAYLAFAVPSLLFTIPLQLLTGQRSAIVTSLNNIITAVNTILALVGRSIPPIPTGTREAAEDVRSGALVSDDSRNRPERSASEGPEPGPSEGDPAESVGGTADEIDEAEDSDNDEAHTTPVAVDVEAPEQDAEERNVVAAEEDDADVDPDTASTPEDPSAVGNDRNGDGGQTDDNDGTSDASQTEHRDESP